jgi:hypothetical protein
VEVVHSGVRAETVEATPTKPTAAATVEVVVEKARDAPEEPSAIKDKIMVEVAVAEEVALAPALVVAMLMHQETELTQEKILQEWVVQEHTRQQKEAVSLLHSPFKNIEKVMKELEAIPELIRGDTEQKGLDV